MSNIVEKLDESINRHLDKMANIGIGTEEMSKAIGETVQLHKLRMDELKFQSEDAERGAKCNLDVQKETYQQLAREDDFHERKKERWFRVGVAAAEIVLPLALYGWLSYVGFAREFDGVITSDTLKRVLTSIKPKR